jgi:hypothetical protein
MSSEVSMGTVATTWQIAGSGDYNADGHTDLIWQNTVTGERGLWLLDYTTLSGYVALPTTDPAWDISN